MTAVALLPRPLVLYATTKEDVSAWADRLRLAGFRRIGRGHRRLRRRERRSVVEGWRGEDSNGQDVATEHDIVVRHLGVRPRGRHAGRPQRGTRLPAGDPRPLLPGGRPDRPRRAALDRVPGEGARRRPPWPASLNQRVVIIAEKGWDRWQSMRRDARRIGTGMYEVSLDSCPTHLSEGYDRNRQWNVRTLNLMAWACLIRLRAPQPPVRAADEPDGGVGGPARGFLRRGGARVAVEIVDGGTNRPGHWEAVVSAQRSIAKDGQRVALDRMHEVLRGSHCAGEILARYYRAHWQAGVLSTGVNCRGCPWCRANRAADYDGAGMCQVAGEPFPAVYSWPGRGRDPLADIRGSSSWLSIWWGNRQERDDLLPQLLERLARRGMSVIGGPGITARLAAQVQEVTWPSPVIVDYDDDLVTTFLRAGDMGARRHVSVPGLRHSGPPEEYRRDLPASSQIPARTRPAGDRNG